MRKLFIILGCTILIITNCAKQTDWTHWRGPNNNGSTADNNWNPDALKNGPKTLWQTEIGKGHSAVTVQGNRMYTMGNHQTITEKDTLEKDVIYCLNTKTGKPIWTHEYKCGEGGWPGPAATPVIDENRLYTVSREGHLFCFNNRNGKIIWQKHLLDDSLSTHPLFSSSAVIAGDLVLFNFNRAGIGFHKLTGELIWNSKITKADFASPVLYNHNDRQLALILNKRNLICVDSQTGEQLWEHNVGWGTADPIVIGDKILFTGQSTTLFQFTIDGLEEVWKNEDIRWQFQSPVVVNGYIYGLSWCHHLGETQPMHCISMASGEVIWKEDMIVWGALIAADNKLIILEGQGKVIIAEASPEGYREFTSAPVVPMSDNSGLENDKKCHCWTHPVLVGGKLYARNNYGTLVCVDMQ